MKRALLVAISAICTASVLVGAAYASQTSLTACRLVTAAEYEQVLGKPVTLSTGEGFHRCNVRAPGIVMGGGGTVSIIPNLTPYTAAYAAYFKRQLTRLPNKQRVSSLGPVAYS
jgi:hypothetical protein